MDIDVGAECEVAWLPYWMQRLDHAHEKFGAMMDVALSLRPSEYVERQVWVTYLDDTLGARSAEGVGADTFMWGSDFPHGDSTWPHSREVIAKNLSGVSPDVARKILHDNAARLYGITV